MSLVPPIILRILKNTGATIFVRGASGIARIVVLLLVARHYGSAEFGQMTLALSIIEILKVCADAGVDITSIRRFASENDRREALFSNVLTMKLVGALVFATIAPAVYVAIIGHTGGLTTMLALVPSLLTGLFFTGFVGYFQSQLRVNELLGGNIVGMSVFILLALGAMVLELPLWLVAIGMPVGELTTVLIFMRVYSRFHSLRPQWDPRIVKDLLLESLPVGIGGVLVVIYLRLDNVMIGWFLGEYEIGQYAFAFRLMEPFSLVFSSLSISLYASLSSTWNTPEAQHNLRTVMNVMMVVLLTALVGFLMTIILRMFIPALAPEYSASVDVLSIMGVTLFVKGANTQLTAILNSLGKFRIITLITAVNLSLALVLNVILIPLYGIVGAALAVLIMESSNTLMQGAAVRYQFKSGKLLGRVM